MLAIPWWSVRPVPARASSWRLSPCNSDATRDPRSSRSTSAARFGQPHWAWAESGTTLAGPCRTMRSRRLFAGIDDPGELAWAAEWVAAILAREGVDVTPEAK